MAASVVTAALQRAVDECGTALFLLKGGTMLRANDSLSIDNPVRVRADVLVHPLRMREVSKWRREL
jgi:hypothetical protein